MTTIQDTAVKRAISILQAVNAKFKVITVDGEEFGELEVVAPRTRRKINNFSSTGYTKVLDALQPGEVAVLEIPPGVPAESFRKPICGSAGRRFGNQNYMTTITGNTVEILRIA